MIRAMTVAILASAGPAGAEPVAITPEVLMDELVGRTMAFVNPLSGQVVGHEQFLTRDKSRWRGSDGFCVIGRVILTAEQICFRYDDGIDVDHCWLPFRDGDDIGYRSVGTGELQMIEPSDPSQVECTPNLMS
ncbi:hypothetical protein [Jannaschia rubra]|nr:hypothetical protein [Jannaschia rubra]